MCYERRMHTTHHHHCHCKKEIHDTKLVVLTGGPGAGKTAIAEIAKRTFCEHVLVLPEAASIIYSGGFWRRPTTAGRKACQYSIFHVQHAQESMIEEEKGHGLVICDRGSLDGLAYWPEPEESFFKKMGTTREAELARYHAIVHLHPPTAENGYNYENPVRTESPEEAAELDARIINAWRGHPNIHFVESTLDFVDKVKLTIDLIHSEMPGCCQSN